MYSPSSFPISKAHSSINLSLSQVITSSSSLPALIRYILRRSDDLLRIFACISTVNASMFTNSQSTVVHKEINTTQQICYTKGKFRYAVAQKYNRQAREKLHKLTQIWLLDPYNGSIYKETILDPYNGSIYKETISRK